MNISNLSVPRKKCLLVAITTAFCWIFLVSTKAGVLGARVPETTSATATATSPKQASKEETETTNIDHEVIDLTSKNFGSTVGIADGNVWLIEFYTPGCSHCRNFATAYQSIAKTFHSDPKSKVRVARVDCTVEKALLTRFSIQGFPSFFLVSGWDVYEFEENRTTMNLIKFAEHGHKKKKVRIY
jgi:thioredoxin-like negative regulator of GroEL